MKTTRTALVVLVVLFVVFVVGLFASASTYEDNYQEECTSYRQHSGNVSGYYDYAVFFEQGYEPVEVETNGEAIYLAPPDGIAWDRVYKCHEENYETTTTMIETTTTTTGDPTTTISISETTSTVPQESSSSTTTTITTTSSVPPATTPTDPDKLPYTGAGAITGMVLAGSALLAGGIAAVRKMTE